MAFDFDALPEDAKRAFFAKVKPGKSSRAQSPGSDEDSNQEPAGDSEARSGEDRQRLVKTVMQASNPRTALQAFAELLFRDQYVGNGTSAKFEQDLQEIRDMVDRLMEMDRKIQPFRIYGPSPYPLTPDYSLSRYPSLAELTPQVPPLWTWHDRSPVRNFDMREFSDPSEDQARRIKQLVKDARTLLGITWDADVNVGERKLEVRSEKDLKTHEVERVLSNFYRWLRTR